MRKKIKTKQVSAKTSIKIGLGYDIHRFVSGRPLVLGGMEIPYDRGLGGHSDADVLVHAVADALLGALGEGDIGGHFPDSDERYRNISSLILLKKVYGLVQAQNYQIGNIDSFIIAEEPKLGAYKEEMAERISRTLDIPKGSVNIKATTNEGLGSLGHKEGIAAYATVVLIKKSHEI